MLIEETICIMDPKFLEQYYLYPGFYCRAMSVYPHYSHKKHLSVKRVQSHCVVSNQLIAITIIEFNIHSNLNPVYLVCWSTDC